MYITGWCPFSVLSPYSGRYNPMELVEAADLLGIQMDDLQACKKIEGESFSLILPVLGGCDRSATHSIDAQEEEAKR